MVPVDVLLQYLRYGWNPSAIVIVEPVYYGAARCTHVYRFSMERYEEAIELIVVATPIVPRILEEYGLTARSTIESSPQARV